MRRAQNQDGGKYEKIYVPYIVNSEILLFSQIALSMFLTVLSVHVVEARLLGRCY